MSKPNSFVAGLLFAFAIFIICSCAVYLVTTVTNQNQLPGSPNADVAANQAGVVAYTTPTITPESALAAPATIPTPIPLLPTVTAGPPSIPTPTSPPLSAEPSPATEPSSPTQASSLPTPTVPPVEPGQLEILSHQSYVDSLGWYHIVGEVQNNGAVPVEFVEVVAKLYDETNTLIGTKLTFTAPDIIFPGGKAPFDIITLRRSQWQKIKEYSLQVKGDAAEKLLQENLVLLDQNTRIDDEFLYVSGEVQNKGHSSALVKLIITLYDANFKVVNTNWSYADAGVIPANQTSTFEIKINHPTDPNNYHYRLQIEEEIIETD